MKIFVDADACPVKNIIVKIAKLKNIEVVMVMDTAHEYEDGYSETIVVDKGRDSVDIFLINLVKEGDIVVTQDYGVAAMALSKKAIPMNQNGLKFTDDNINVFLDMRHVGQKLRKHGGKVKGPKKRKIEDDEKFQENFIKTIELIQENKQS